MKTIPLETENPGVRLIEPDIARDTPLSIQWLDGDTGRDTLRLMGVTDDKTYHRPTNKKNSGSPSS